MPSPALNCLLSVSTCRNLLLSAAPSPALRGHEAALESYCVPDPRFSLPGSVIQLTDVWLHVFLSVPYSPVISSKAGALRDPLGPVMPFEGEMSFPRSEGEQTSIRERRLRV